MNSDFNLDQYLTDGVESIVSDAMKAALKNPKESAFLLQYAASAKRAAKKRAQHATEGRHVPSFLIASITNRCNLHCAGCYARANHLCNDSGDNGQLTEKQWDDVFAQAAKIGVSFVLLAGGEPMLRRGVIERAAAHRNILFPVFTNGTVLDEELIELLDQNRNLVPIVSIEGDQEQTDARRGDGTYDALHESMRALKQRGIFFGASITLTTANLKTVTSDKFLSALKENGCKIAFYVDYVPADPGTESLAPGEVDQTLLADRLAELRTKQDGMVYVSFPGDEQFAGGCLAAGRGFFHINPYGGAEPCPFSPVSDTSIQDVSLLDALNSPLFVRLRASELLKEHHDGACALFGHEDEVREMCAKN